MSVKTVPSATTYTCDGCLKTMDSNGGYTMYEVKRFWTCPLDDSWPHHFCPDCWKKMVGALEPSNPQS